MVRMILIIALIFVILLIKKCGRLLAIYRLAHWSSVSLASYLLLCRLCLFLVLIPQNKMLKAEEIERKKKSVGK